MPKTGTSKYLILEKAKTEKTTEKKAKTPRAASPYNLFMKTELPKVKKEFPNLTHKEAFVKAAGNWKNSPQNPQNKKK